CAPHRDCGIHRSERRTPRPLQLAPLSLRPWTHPANFRRLFLRDGVVTGDSQASGYFAQFPFVDAHLPGHYGKRNHPAPPALLLLAAWSQGFGFRFVGIVGHLYSFSISGLPSYWRPSGTPNRCGPERLKMSHHNAQTISPSNIRLQIPCNVSFNVSLSLCGVSSWIGSVI